MSHWRLTLAYDGTPYHGWQVQPGLRTVQGTLAGAIEQIAGEAVLPQGSGRTDTGVHALGQVASFSLDAGIPAGNLQRALNRILPGSIRVLTAEVVPESFHARHSAVCKTYEYRIFPVKGLALAEGERLVYEERICPPTLAPWVWACRWPIELERLNLAARLVLGTHDFSSFAASDPDAATRAGDAPDGEQSARPPVRTIWRSEWQVRDSLLVYTVTGSGFLHHMVRNLVGTFVQAGAGRMAVEALPGILAARSRSAAGPTAPASGLFLVSVEYAAEPVLCNPGAE